jgi:XTP/dITP diphosphohydrolase
MKRLVLATQNKNKLKEVVTMLEPLGYEVLSLEDVSLGDYDVIEDGETFEENALKKAKEIATIISMPVLADDSGLMVDALYGAPGVFSARYSGEGATTARNNEKLLNALEGLHIEKRNAKFVCVMAYVDPNGEEYIARGEAKGRILEKQVGTSGFGYDPLFFVPELEKTYAELSIEEKNKVSHRYKALVKMRSYLEAKK